MVGEAAAGAGADALRYFIADKYVKAFDHLAQNPAQKLAPPGNPKGSRSG